jgi:porphobilinogen deaminase
LGVVSELGFSEPELTLEALVASADGTSVTRQSITSSVIDADAAGRQLASRLLETVEPATSREHL